MLNAIEATASNKAPRTIIEDVQELGGMAAEMVQEKAEQVRAGAAGMVKDGRACVGDAEQRLEKYIREQPIMSVLMAAGVGLLISRFMLRR